MGTRHLIAVEIDKEYKIAQYGQWDGYADGQGVAILDFLRTVNVDDFCESVRATRFLDEADHDTINSKYGREWSKHYPQLSRNVGSDILSMVLGGTRELQNHIAFAGDSLMCEYAYIISLDKMVLEVYKGFNTDCISEGRFLSSDDSLEKAHGYEPVKIVATFELSNIPSDEDFITKIDPPEES